MLGTQGVIAKLLPAAGELVQVILIFEALTEEDVHDRKREEAIGAGADLQVLVGQRGGARTVRVDDDELAAAAAGLFDEGPQVNVIAVHIAGPDDDQAGEREVLGRSAEASAVNALERGAAGGRADGAVELRGAEPVKEAAVHGAEAELTDGAGVAVGEDALGAELGGDLLEARGDLV